MRIFVLALSASLLAGCASEDAAAPPPTANAPAAAPPAAAQTAENCTKGIFWPVLRQKGGCLTDEEKRNGMTGTFMNPGPAAAPAAPVAVASNAAPPAAPAARPAPAPVAIAAPPPPAAQPAPAPVAVAAPQPPAAAPAPAPVRTAAAAPPPAPAPLPAPAPEANTTGSGGMCFLWPFCGGSDQAAPANTTPQRQQATASVGDSSSGGGVFSGIFGGSDDADTQPQLGVNTYLWRATLDTLNFMPLASEDPVGGVIITDWYSSPDNQNERMKVTAYILDKRLRADALKVAVFRQTRTANGWADAQTNPDTAVKVENAILTRARELHLATAQ